MRKGLALILLISICVMEMSCGNRSNTMKRYRQHNRGRKNVKKKKNCDCPDFTYHYKSGTSDTRC